MSRHSVWKEEETLQQDWEKDPDTARNQSAEPLRDARQTATPREEPTQSTIQISETRWRSAYRWPYWIGRQGHWEKSTPGNKG